VQPNQSLLEIASHPEQSQLYSPLGFDKNRV
jgi:hypothetical protein